MSTGAVVNSLGVGGGGIGGATTSTGQGTRPLTSDAIFRIEVSLSSRKSSAIVMKTTARLYALEGATPAVPGASPGKDAEWKSMAYGAPCIQLMRESTKHNCPFHIKIVIAEVESGISLWELEVDRSSRYNAMQNNFHTFSVGGKTYAIQFANDGEAERMLESIVDLFEQKEKAETVSFEKKPEEPIFKKPKSIRKLNKKDISTPCNFKHVSGITLQRTQTCEEELRGTIQRKMRSMTLSSLSRRKIRQEGGKVATPNGPGVVNAAGGNVTLQQGKSEFRGLDVSPMIARKAGAKDSPKTSRSNSLLHKFGSLRLSKKKPYSQVALKGENGRPQSTIDGQVVQDKNGMSLPSHYKQQSRPPLTGDLFDRRPLYDQNGQPVKALSLSSDNLADPRASSNPNSSVNRDTVSSPTRKAASLERRHTFVAPTSPLRKSPGPAQFNYTPYRKSIAPGQSSQQQQQFQQFPQQNLYHQQSNGGVPYNYGRSATLGTHSAQYFQQQMRPYAGSGGAGTNSNLTNVSGRLHVSDMGLHRSGVTGQIGYQVPQNSLGGGYGPPSSATGGVATTVGAGQGRRRLSMNELHLVLMDGGNQMPPTASTRGHRVSFDGGIPVQQQVQIRQQQPPIASGGPMQQQYPYPQPGPSQVQQGGGGQTHPQMAPLPSPGQGPGPVSATTTIVSAPPPLPPNSMTTPTSTGVQNGYYPPTAMAGQIQGYPPPPPGVMSTPGVISAPQQQPYSMQNSGANVPNSVMAPYATTTTNTSPSRGSGTRGRGDPVPYAIVGVSKTTSPRHHHTQPGQTGQTGTRTSPGSMGRGGTGGGGAAVLSKLPTSPSRQASVPQSSTGFGGNRPREVVTVSSPSYHQAMSSGGYYDQLPPSQRPVASQHNAAYYQPQGNTAAVMAAPPPTKYTNLQLHQQYRQQYMRLQNQGSKTTPYHVQSGGGGGSSSRPTIQQYQEYALYQQKQQKERPPVAVKKSPPKYHHSHSQPHPHGHSQHSPHRHHNNTGHSPSHTHTAYQAPIMHRQQYQQPNNVSANVASAITSPQGSGRPLHVQMNDTSGPELVPKPNTGTPSSRGRQFESESTQPYDVLPTEGDSSTNLDGSLVSVTDELDRFTEEMSKALEQFDSLLQPQTSKPITHTSI